MYACCKSEAFMASDDFINVFPSVPGSSYEPLSSVWRATDSDIYVQSLVITVDCYSKSL